MKGETKPGVVVAQHNPSTKEVEAGRSGVQGRSRLYSKLKHNEVGLALRSSTLRVPPTGSTLPGDHPELCLTSTKSAALSSPANHPLSTGHPCFPMCGLKGSLRCHHTHTHTHTTETVKGVCAQTCQRSQKQATEAALQKMAYPETT